MSAPLALIAVDAIVSLVFFSLTVVSVRNREQPGATSAGILWVILGIIATILGFTHAAILPEQLAVYVVVMGWLIVVPLWAAFVFAYTGRGPSLDRRWVAFAAMYVLIAAAATQLAGYFDGVVGQLLRVEASILQTGLIGIGLFGVFLIIRATMTDDDISKGQSITIALGGFGVSLLVFSVSNVSPDSGRVPLLINGFLAVISASFAAGVFRYRLFSESAGISFLVRQSVLEEMSEAVIVVDREQRIVDANEAAVQTLGIRLAQDAGRPAETVLGYALDSSLDEIASVPTPAGQRQFDVSKSELTNAQDDAVGASYLFQDVTDKRTRKQRLEIFNRVLRHNLRNDLDAIRGFAEVLADGSLDAPEEVAERIRTTAGNLADTGATVERSDWVTTQDTLELQNVDLEELVEEVVTTVGRTYDCDISLSMNVDRAMLNTDRSVLRTALYEVVENAVVHNKQEVPAVEIEITRTKESARVSVCDDGPGIPEREQGIVLEGEETPLKHATGLGLWLISWAVTRLGGELSFEDVSDSGSIVVLDIPDRVKNTPH
jgi:signal transduction histidine kinase